MVLPAQMVAAIVPVAIVGTAFTIRVNEVEALVQPSTVFTVKVPV